MEERAREVQRRQAVLDEIQRRAPIVQFSRDFIKWTLESDVDRPPPSCPQVRVAALSPHSPQPSTLRGRALGCRVEAYTLKPSPVHVVRSVPPGGEG